MLSRLNVALIVLFVVVNGSKWLFGSKRLPTPVLHQQKEKIFVIAFFLFPLE